MSPAHQTTTRRPLRSVRAIFASVSSAIFICLLLPKAQAQDMLKPLTVPVTGSPAAPESTYSQMSMSPVVNEQIQPTLPGGKLPQYQLSPRMRVAETGDRIDNATVRFLLALPAEPILIEARLTIDGEAFRKQRERRVQSTFKAALEPEPEIETLRPLRAEKTDTATAHGEPSEETSQEPAVPPLPAYRSAATDVEKLRRYIAFIGREPSTEEVRWFFVNRLDGPTLLLLRDNFQAFRADQAPIFRILDRNRDGTLSVNEIDQTVESFLECDLNRNQIVDYLEIDEAADDPRVRSGHLLRTSPLLYLLPTSDNADSTYASLSEIYAAGTEDSFAVPERFDPNSNGQWEEDELAHLRSMPPDLRPDVAFDSSSAEKSSLTVSADSLRSLAADQITASVVNSSIVLSRSDCELWLSAIQPQAGDQISIGAVNDGYPMLPVLDPNDDGRFTLRELRGVTEAVRKFDVDADGQIREDELRPTIRLAFGLHASVHQALAGVRSVHTPGSTAPSGPDWFVRMDRNQDRDLTRQEFPGTDEQFDQLDADGDKLISAAEALEYDRRNSPPQSEQNTPEPIEPDDATETTENPNEN